MRPASWHLSDWKPCCAAPPGSGARQDGDQCQQGERAAQKAQRDGRQDRAAVKCACRRNGRRYGDVLPLYDAVRSRTGRSAAYDRGAGEAPRSPAPPPTKRNIARFADAARARLREESGSLRKRYMRQLVSRIEVGDRQIRISGPHAELAEGVLDSGSEPAAGVPSFGQDWWARQDSNLRQHRYERRVLTS